MIGRAASRRGRAHAIPSLLAFAVLLVFGVLTPREGHGRLQPYYILRTSSDASTLQPRILFVLDSSGSMALQAQSNAALCSWGECEDSANAGTTAESRMAAARRAVHTIVDSFQDQAKFALMTFEQNDPHN